ncbi:RNase H domain-containing protein [Caerostris extrusa]|uniref:RNase H domain-containing protein n=1 Tax=Caerostris extrusa TaxID=172846 RepID=A0AAV4RTW9_CAEEX|nr:RNase H domain-containing protein [Caerostris extrusa]
MSDNDRIEKGGDSRVYRMDNCIVWPMISRSSNLLSNWTNNQRLKKDSPLGLIWKQGLADIEVEPSVLFNLLTPTTVLSNVTFNEDLKVKFIKHEEHPELLRQLALEIINNISPRALAIYTDGSKSDSGRTGSGIFMKTSTGEFRYHFRNPDHSSVFRSELTAISEALSLALDFKVPDVWILTDTIALPPGCIRKVAIDFSNCG